MISIIWVLPQLLSANTATNYYNNVNKKKLSTANASMQITDPKKPIYITSKSNIITLRLKSNPTTGFSWWWFPRAINNNLLQPVSHQFISSKTGLIGAGGIDVWRFKVLPRARIVPTMLLLRLGYARSWEPGAQSNAFRIYVEPNA